MKRWIVLLLCIGALFALACVERPEEPVCGEGQITITPAQWVEDQTHQECAKMGWVRHGFFDWRYECIKYKTVVDVPAHWTEPVCETPPQLCEDPLALNYQQEGECTYPPPTPEPPPYCKPYNVGTWYECNTGNSTWSAPSASKCWCQGLTGRVHYHTTYDCGNSYVTEGNWDEAPDWLGHYPGEVCPVGGC